MENLVKSHISLEDLKNNPKYKEVYFSNIYNYSGEFKEVYEYFINASIMSDRSLNTINAYYSDINMFLEYLVKNYKKIDKVKKIKSMHISRFLLELQMSKNNSSSTIDRKKSSLEIFFLFLIEQGYIDNNENPMPKTDALKLKSKAVKKKPVFLETNEIKLLFDEIYSNNEKDFFKYRDYTIFALLFNSGLRVSELVSLNLIDLENLRNYGTALITGKGNKERYIAVSSNAFKTGYLKYIDKYLELRKEIENKGRYPKDKDALFLSIRGSRLCARAIQITLKSYIESISIDKNITPHKIRHSFASHLIRNGCNIREVQSLLGHENISSTQIYTHLVTDNLKEASKKLDSVQTQE